MSKGRRQRGSRRGRTRALRALHRDGTAPPFQREQTVTGPLTRTGTKPQRNQPCFCGSGLKYKDCHERLEQAAPEQKQAVRNDIVKRMYERVVQQQASRVSFKTEHGMVTEVRVGQSSYPLMEPVRVVAGDRVGLHMQNGSPAKLVITSALTGETKAEVDILCLTNPKTK